MMAATHSLLIARETLLVPVAIRFAYDFRPDNDPKQICWGITYIQGGPVQHAGHTTNLLLINE